MNKNDYLNKVTIIFQDGEVKTVISRDNLIKCNDVVDFFEDALRAAGFGEVKLVIKDKLE